MKRMVNDVEKLNKLAESTEVTDDSLEVSKSVVKLDGTKLEVNEDEVDITTESLKVNGQSIVAGKLTPHRINIPNELTEDLEFTPPPNSHVVIKTSDGEGVTITQSRNIIIKLQDNARYTIESNVIIKQPNNNYINLLFYGCKYGSFIVPDITFSQFHIESLSAYDFQNEDFNENYFDYEFGSSDSFSVSIIIDNTSLNPIYIGTIGLL